MSVLLMNKFIAFLQRYETLEITSQFFILEQCAGCDNGLHWIKVNESTAVESENVTVGETVLP